MSGQLPQDGEQPTQRTGKRDRVISHNQILLAAFLVCLLAVVLIFWPASKPASEAQAALSDVPKIGRISEYHPPPPPVQPVPVIYNPSPPAAAPPPAAPPPDVKPVGSNNGTSSGGGRSGVLTYNLAPLPEAFKPKPAAAAETADASGPPNKTHIAYKAAAIPGVKAGSMGDTTFTLFPGLLRCTMVTPINSEREGPFTCTVPGDVKTHAGVTVMDRDTIISGSYSSKVGTGQKRLPALAAYAYNTKGNCAVSLGGPMADNEGRTGLPGNVDTHDWQKFGLAFILTGVEIGASLAQAALSQGGNTYLSIGNGGSVTSLAQEVLRQRMTIQDTVETLPGADVGVWITIPANFSDCFGLSTK